MESLIVAFFCFPETVKTSTLLVSNKTEVFVCVQYLIVCHEVVQQRMETLSASECI